MKVRDVEPKHISGFSNVFLREDFEKNIEIPCLAACLWFYDLNIGTSATNCHKEDPNVYLYFDADSLDETNTSIALELVREGILEYTEGPTTKWYGICFPATLDDDVEEISNRLLSVAKRFQYQDVLSPSWYYSRFDYYKRYLIDSDEDFEKLCQEFGIEKGIYIEDESIGFDSEKDYNKLANDNLLDTFGERLVALLDSKFQSEIDKGMGDANWDIVFVNQELAIKHQQYVESQKGKGAK